MPKHLPPMVNISIRDSANPRGFLPYMVILTRRHCGLVRARVFQKLLAECSADSLGAQTSHFGEHGSS